MLESNNHKGMAESSSQQHRLRQLMLSAQGRLSGAQFFAAVWGVLPAIYGSLLALCVVAVSVFLWLIALLFGGSALNSVTLLLMVLVLLFVIALGAAVMWSTVVVTVKRFHDLGVSTNVAFVASVGISVVLPTLGLMVAASSPVVLFILGLLNLLALASLVLLSGQRHSNSSGPYPHDSELYPASLQWAAAKECPRGAWWVLCSTSGRLARLQFFFYSAACLVLSFQVASWLMAFAGAPLEPSRMNPDQLAALATDMRWLVIFTAVFWFALTSAMMFKRMNDFDMPRKWSFVVVGFFVFVPLTGLLLEAPSGEQIMQTASVFFADADMVARSPQVASASESYAAISAVWLHAIMQPDSVGRILALYFAVGAIFSAVCLIPGVAGDNRNGPPRFDNVLG